MLGLGNSLVVGAPISGFPCLKLDGTDDYINITHHADVKPTTAITISAWVNLDTVHGATGWINPDGDNDHLETIIGTINNGGYMINILYAGTEANPTTKIEFVIKVTDSDGAGTVGYVRPIWGGVTSTTGSTTLHEIKDFSGWVHLACTWRAGVALLYINGSNDLFDGDVDTSATQTVNTGVSSNPILYSSDTQVMIGADTSHATNNAAHNFLVGGLVSEVAVWGAAASASNILEIYNSGIPGFDLTTNAGSYTNSINLNGYWKLDGDANDSSGKVHHGNENNSPSFVEI